MTDRNELRRLAEAADTSPQWYQEESFSQLEKEEDAAFAAAASPDMVLGLLDERDQLRAVATRLKGALERIENGCASIYAHDTAREALADPTVSQL